ncbi:MAG: ferredoxin [Lachnospiraceae bacterium]|nr:ferredoxin [Lachnospiraceae bacterium]
MKITIEEKKILAVFGCGNYQNTIKRLCMIAALTPDAAAKALFYQLALRLSEELAEKDYCVFINGIHKEMEMYDFAVWVLKRLFMGG